VCKRFRCVVQRQVTNGTTPFEEVRAIVATTKTLTDKLRAAISASPGGGPQSNLYAFLRTYPDKIRAIRAKRALSPAEQAFIADAFEFVKLMDRWFEKTSLLGKVADLVIELAEPPLPRLRVTAMPSRVTKTNVKPKT